MDYSLFLSWTREIVSSFASVGKWLISPLLSIGGFSITPLILFTSGGLIAFIVVAIVKWGLS